MFPVAAPKQAWQLLVTRTIHAGGHCMAINADAFSELANVSPVYCSGLAYVIADGGNLHFALYQETVLGDGTRDRVIVQRLIMPADAWIEARGLTEFEMQAAGKPGLKPIDLLKAARA
jgi:hypothetical protein